MPIIAFTGTAGCGKDTAASFLENSESTRLSFAGSLREDLCLGTKDVQRFWGELYQAISLSGNELAQAWGTFHERLPHALRQKLIDNHAELKTLPQQPDAKFWKFWNTCLPGFAELRQKVQGEIAEHGRPVSVNKTLGKAPASLIYTTDRAIKESLCSGCGGLSPRLLMQSYGSFMRNSVNEHYWVSRLTEKVETARRANPYQRILITDLRYGNEADAMRGLGALIVHVERDDSSDGAKGAAAKHESEAGVERKPGDVIVHNNQGLEELGAAMKAAVSGGVHPLIERIAPERVTTTPLIQVQHQGVSQFQNNAQQKLDIAYRPHIPAISAGCRP